MGCSQKREHQVVNSRGPRSCSDLEQKMMKEHTGEKERDLWMCVSAVGEGRWGRWGWQADTAAAVIGCHLPHLSPLPPGLSLLIKVGEGACRRSVVSREFEGRDLIIYIRWKQQRVWRILWWSACPLRELYFFISKGRHGALECHRRFLLQISTCWPCCPVFKVCWRWKKKKRRQSIKPDKCCEWSGSNRERAANLTTWTDSPSVRQQLQEVSWHAGSASASDSPSGAALTSITSGSLFKKLGLPLLSQNLKRASGWRKSARRSCGR